MRLLQPRSCRLQAGHPCAQGSVPVCTKIQGCCSASAAVGRSEASSCDDRHRERYDSVVCKALLFHSSQTNTCRCVLKRLAGMDGPTV